MQEVHNFSKKKQQFVWIKACIDGCVAFRSKRGQQNGHRFLDFLLDRREERLIKHIPLITLRNNCEYPSRARRETGAVCTGLYVGVFPWYYARDIRVMDC